MSTDIPAESDGGSGAPAQSEQLERVEQRRSVVTRALVAVLHGYQRYVSPALPPSCRFYPSCSAYAVEALQVHGALMGSWLTLRRLLKCAPWHPGGIDLVPPARDDRSAQDHHEEQAPC